VVIFQSKLLRMTMTRVRGTHHEIAYPVRIAHLRFTSHLLSQTVLIAKPDFVTITHTTTAIEKVRGF